MKDKTYIYGIHPVLEALSSGENIDKVFLIKDINPIVKRDILQKAKQINVPVQFVPIEKIKRMSNNQNHQGVVAAIAPLAFSEIEHLVPWWWENGIVPKIILLDEVTDVRNFGAIGRTAECTGINAILFPWKNSAQINAQTIKASAGALYNVPLCRTKNIVDSIKFLKQSGFFIVSCSEKGAKNYTEIKYDKPTVFVFGSEEYGISADLLKLSDEIVQIPMCGNVASLNVSVAVGVVLYEALRQNE